MTFDPIKTVEALSRAIAATQDGAHKVYGLTPCEAFQIHTLTLVRDAIMAGISTETKHRYADGQACEYPGCAHYIEHPCPGCGRKMAHGTAI